MIENIKNSQQFYETGTNLLNRKVCKKVRRANREILLLAALALSYGPVSNLGMGGILFTLPLIAAYVFMVGLIICLPILSIEIIRSKGPTRKIDKITAYAAAAVNLAALAGLGIGILQIFIKLQQLNH